MLQMARSGVLRSWVGKGVGLGMLSCVLGLGGGDFLGRNRKGREKGGAKTYLHNTLGWFAPSGVVFCKLGVIGRDYPFLMGPVIDVFEGDDVDGLSKVDEKRQKRSFCTRSALVKWSLGIKLNTRPYEHYSILSMLFPRRARPR